MHEDVKEKIEQAQSEGSRLLYSRPKTLREVRTHYCSGCGHGILHKLIAQCIDEMGLRERTVIMAPVGCAVLLYDYLDVDGLEAAHGRAPAVATGVKRANPDNIVISYQGDGDLLAIGMAETVHAANRGENITVIFVNNTVYGMTGGQMAPTTLVQQKTSTTIGGRNVGTDGAPIRAAELLNTLDAPYFITRCSLHNAAQVRKTRNNIAKALRYQNEGRGYSFVEVLSMCPTAWGKSPAKSAEWISQTLTPIYPLGTLRDQGDQSKQGAEHQVAAPQIEEVQ
ncbi:thiamine pyrophosphate-dependent enzyme [Candidatus Haliotispira prima]|uniref:Thiamine pyrophosphate-dependent enzyme n=1 Tax=Candidatus Haliotispira prima TaxID=3034016 RepID=A0ABY8MEY5_9SPIO|nr:thiamine pyrophosphate-dependent enzyme [Candidatus Haliotispira prima]